MANDHICDHDCPPVGVDGAIPTGEQMRARLVDENVIDAALSGVRAATARLIACESTPDQFEDRVRAILVADRQIIIESQTSLMQQFTDLLDGVAKVRAERDRARAEVNRQVQLIEDAYEAVDDYRLRAEAAVTELAKVRAESDGWNQRFHAAAEQGDVDANAIVQLVRRAVIAERRAERVGGTWHVQTGESRRTGITWSPVASKGNVDDDMERDVWHSEPRPITAEEAPDHA